MKLQKLILFVYKTFTAPLALKFIGYTLLVNTLYKNYL